MSNEILFTGKHAITAYVIMSDRTGRPWSTSGGTGGFESWADADIPSYALSAVEQGSLSHRYTASVPTAVPAGTYGVEARQQLTGTPLATDPTISNGNVEWNGVALLPLADLATSGLISQFGPVRLARGVMVQNFPIYFKSSADHVTPFFSGTVSGQIARDGSTSFGPLQSGAFTEVGQGFFNLSALTSGDLLANTVKLLFTAVGVSGGNADPVPYSFILQKTSGQ